MPSCTTISPGVNQTCSWKDERQISSSMNATKHLCHIFMAFWGIGILPKQRPRVFFFKPGWGGNGGGETGSYYIVQAGLELAI
jgi:hypothetical protein